MIALKDGVDARGIQPELALGLAIADGVYVYMGVPVCMVTALKNGKHMEGSLHYKGLAADLRLPSRYATKAAIDQFVLGHLKSSLGPQWDVLLESDHFHIEFDPEIPGDVQHA